MDEIERLRNELAENEKRHQVELVFAKNHVKSLKGAMAMFDMGMVEEGCLEQAAEQFVEENKWLFEKDSAAFSTAMPHGTAEIQSPEKMSDAEYYTSVLNLK